MTRTPRAPATPAEEMRAISDELRAVVDELAALNRDAPVAELRGLKAADRLAPCDLERAHRHYRRLVQRCVEVFHSVYPDSPIGAALPAQATLAA